MKKIKQLCFLASLLIAGTALQSCSDDNETITYYPAIGTVENENGKLLFDTDKYGMIEPTNPVVFTNMEAAEDGQRAMASLSFIESEDKEEGKERIIPKAVVLDLYKILTKDANDIRDGQEDIYGNDPILITGGYLSEKHLNLEFNIWRYEPSIAHRISLVVTDESFIDPEGLIKVELRHNREKDQMSVRSWGLVSFNLSSIPGFDDERCKGLIIEYSTSESNKTTFTVKKGGQNGNQQRTTFSPEKCTYIE